MAQDRPVPLAGCRSFAFAQDKSELSATCHPERSEGSRLFDQGKPFDPATVLGVVSLSNHMAQGRLREGSAMRRISEGITYKSQALEPLHYLQCDSG